VTGAPVLVTGHLVKTPSPSIRGINVMSEITFVDGYPSVRTTHMMIETRPVGRAELTIIELPLRRPDQHARPPCISGGSIRDERLYWPDDSTFAENCRERWKMVRNPFEGDQ
jgi:hypothetical protein